MDQQHWLYRKWYRHDERLADIWTEISRQDNELYEQQQSKVTKQKTRALGR